MMTMTRSVRLSDVHILTGSHKYFFLFATRRQRLQIDFGAFVILMIVFRSEVRSSFLILHKVAMLGS